MITLTIKQLVFLLGMVIGTGFVLTLPVHAYTAYDGTQHGIEFIENADAPASYALQKWYDTSDNVVCYTYYAEGISCLKNI